MADVLTDMGDYAEARQAYETSLAIKKEIGGETRGEAVILGQLGTLALREGNLAEAEQRYKEALAIFHALNEPAVEAVIWNNLGEAYRNANAYDAAEAAYRESANLKEAQGDLAGAARTWNNLAVVTQLDGKPQEAEGWYRKALEVLRTVGNPNEIAFALNNLADLLQSSEPTPNPSLRQAQDTAQDGKLEEAQQLAKEALTIRKNLDLGVSEIWKTYTILAKIADKERQPEQARAHRRAARQAKAAFLGTRHELQRYEELIAALVAAAQGNAAALDMVKEAQEQMRQADELNRKFADAIDRLLAGERDEDALCDPLHYDPAMILLAALERLRG